MRECRPAQARITKTKGNASDDDQALLSPRVLATSKRQGLAEDLELQISRLWLLMAVESKAEEHQGEHPLQPEAEAAFFRSSSRGWTVI